METQYRIGTRVFLDWEIVREIGSGSSGDVFEIQKQTYGVTTSSALKVIRIPKSRDEIMQVRSTGMDEPSVQQYFRGCVEDTVQEIQTMAGLKSHPSIVGYEDHVVIPHEDGIGWDILIRMELLKPLLTYQQEHPLNGAEVLQMGKEICSALQFCQERGLIHRDIKPENIFVSPLKRFKVGDFGIARSLERTSAGLSVKGTESYMAPEVYKGEPYGPTVDIYSLGLVLYRFMNQNRLPLFPPAPQPITYASHQEALMRRMRGEEFPMPCDADDAFGRIILKACSYYPQNRYHSAGEMLYALNQIVIRKPGGTMEVRRASGPDQGGYPQQGQQQMRGQQPVQGQFVQGQQQMRGQQPMQGQNPNDTMRVRRAASQNQNGGYGRQQNGGYAQNQNGGYAQNQNSGYGQQQNSGYGQQGQDPNATVHVRRAQGSDSNRYSGYGSSGGQGGEDRQQNGKKSGSGSGGKKIWIIAAAVLIAVIAIADIWGVRYIMGSGDSSETSASAEAESTSEEAASGEKASGEEEKDSSKASDTDETEEEEAEEEQEEEDEEANGALLLDSAPSTSGYSEVTVASAEASSTISQKNTDNGPMRLFDGREDTSWQEGVDGYGVGESVSCTFNKTSQVKYLAFKLGNWRNEKYFSGNAVPKTLTLIFGDYETQITFSGEMKEEWVELPDGVSADGMTFIIDEVYKGTSWDDTVITNITIYGK